MVNLIEFWNKNINKNENFYNYKFKDLNIKSVSRFCFYDDCEIIKSFKKLIEPKENYSELENIEFIIMCFYLNQNNYYIEEFPDFLERPTNCHDLSYCKIRNKLVEEGLIENGEVKWQSRRNYIDNMRIVKEKDKFIFNKNTHEVIKKVSLNNDNFNIKNNDEKLSIITNALENLLKDSKKDKYKQLNTSNFFNLIDNDKITKYRKILDCYRHSHKEAIKERENINEDSKRFLVIYGIMLINAVDILININNSNIKED